MAEQPEPLMFRSGARVEVNGQPATVVGYLVIVNLDLPGGGIKPAIVPIAVATLPPVEAEQAALHVIPMNGGGEARRTC